MINDLSALPKRYYGIIDVIICLPFLIVPLLIELPYRVNIFLSWEGAYRLYLGQMPFRDFGLPLGFGYWIIPAIFFKIFGPTYLSLIKAQVFINIISLASVRGILYNLKVKPILVTLSLGVFCISYVIFNFWPWYNHSVVVFELASFYFITRYLKASEAKLGWLSLLIGGALMFLSFFTKQDGGAVGFMIALGLLGYHAYTEKRYKGLLLFAGSFLLVAGIMIIPFIHHDFFYWFNLGQAPHSARISLAKLIDVFFIEATWEKIYLSIFVLVLIVGGKSKWKSIVEDKYLVYLMILSIGLIGQAVVTRVSSPLPTNHMSYFHAFGFVLIACSTPIAQSVHKIQTAGALAVIMILSFSTGYWKYVKGHLGLSISKADNEIPWNHSPWVATDLEGFEKIKMPPETIAGIKELLDSEIAKNEDLKVLNMSELTPLALHMDYQPLIDQPLWYHMNIGIFQREVDLLCERVENQEYDIVLFEYIPGLVQFYPDQVREALRKNYHLSQTFMAPRKLENSIIEVFVKGEPNYYRENADFQTALEKDSIDRQL